VCAAGSTSYDYYANGNPDRCGVYDMTKRGSQTLTWDAENRVATAAGETYTYDGDGARVKKTVGGVTTLYVNMYYEKNISSGVATSYYYLGGKLVAVKKGSALEYVHQDHLGSTSVTTNTSGSTVSSLRYLPYGGERSSSGTPPTDEKFTGQRLDATGLYYYGARYYDASIARFISADPLVQTMDTGQALNRYAYVFGNPLKYVDPTGLRSEEELLAGGVSQTQIDKRKGDSLLWNLILTVYAYERFSITSGGVSSTYWFTYVLNGGPQKGGDLEDYPMEEVCCDPVLMLKYLTQTPAGTTGGTAPVGTVGTTPGVITLPGNRPTGTTPEIHLVVGYGPAFEPKGDGYVAERAGEIALGSLVVSVAVLQFTGSATAVGGAAVTGAAVAGPGGAVLLGGTMFVLNAGSFYSAYGNFKRGIGLIQGGDFLSPPVIPPGVIR